MYDTALLIYNGNAGQANIDKIFKNIIPILSTKINHLMLSKTQAEGDAERIAKEAGDRYEVIISLGGDGTLHEIINGIAELNKPPIIGILPGGTCNDLARSLKIPLDMEEATHTILRGKTKAINIGEVNNRYFTNLVGIGLITEISESINSDFKNLIGRMSYYTAAIKSLTDQNDFEFILETENEKIKEKAGMIVVLNSYHVGSTYVPVKDIDMTDDLLDVFIIYEAGFPLLMKYLTQKESFEDTITKNEVKHIQAKNIKIETNKEMPLDIDGEVYLKTPINIKMVKKNFNFIIG